MAYALKNHGFQTWSEGLVKNAIEDDHFSDVTLVSEDDQIILAHKIILSSSSPFFENILRKHNQLTNHPNPLIFVGGISHKILISIVDFIYQGEVKVAKCDFEMFVDACKQLKIKGASEELEKVVETDVTDKPVEHLKKEHEALGDDDKDEQMYETVHENIEMELFLNSQVVEQEDTYHISPGVEQEDTQYISPGVEQQDTKGHIRELSTTYATKDTKEEYLVNDISYNTVNSQYRSTYHTPKVIKPKNLSCHLCDYKVHRNDLLKLHMNSKHNAEKFPCQNPVCGKIYPSKINLKHHMKANHECNVCGKEVPSMNELKLHKKISHNC